MIPSRREVVPPDDADIVTFTPSTAPLAGRLALEIAGVSYGFFTSSILPLSVRRTSACGERAGSAMRGARPLEPEVRPPRSAIGRELFSNDLTDGIEGRLSVDVLK